MFTFLLIWEQVYYLQPGNSVAKQPHATYLLLWRHHQLSKWQLVPQQPQERLAA